MPLLLNVRLTRFWKKRRLLFIVSGLAGALVWRRLAALWSEKWIAEFGDPGSGGVTLELPWSASATCLVCARREHPACNLL